ncbi:MAG: CDP-alcohol phosphatidyltransferase family protein [Deltaproteobacteria bacterium]|nr:CDP-alcohol phosphatidyltransferase family protein [Deltaproteobacteria bacterium]
MEKTAIILAPDDRGLQPVFGIPAVRRLALLILQMGLRAVHIVGHVNPLTAILSDLLPPQAFHQLDDPSSLDRVAEGLALLDEERVLVLKANLVIDRHSLARLIEAGNNSGLYYMEAVGENGAERLYVCSPADLVSVFRGLWSLDSSYFTIPDKAQLVRGVAGLPYAADKGEEQIRSAEAKLIAALSFQTAAGDGFLARHFDRRISRAISERLARTRATPNQITLGGMTIGLIGAYLLSWPGYWSHLIGSLLFLFCVIVDGVDGEVARLTVQETRFGLLAFTMTQVMEGTCVLYGFSWAVLD